MTNAKPHGVNAACGVSHAGEAQVSGCVRGVAVKDVVERVRVINIRASTAVPGFFFFLVFFFLLTYRPLVCSVLQSTVLGFIC